MSTKKKIFLILIGILISLPLSVLAATMLFSDVPQDQWFTDAVYSLTEKNIVEGYADGTFRPSNNVNRAELAVMLDRLITHLSAENKLAPLSEFGAFTILKSYKGCTYDGLTFEDSFKEYGEIKLEQRSDGKWVYVAKSTHYCEVSLDTGKLLDYQLRHF